MNNYNEDAILELETFFAAAEIPTSIRLGAGTLVTDCQKMIDNHLSNVKKNIGKPVAIPFFDRLYKLKSHIENPSVD